MSNRRIIRETVLQAVYAWVVGKDSPEHVLQTLITPPFRDQPKSLLFAEQLFLRSIDTHDEADELIAGHIANWELERLALVDRVILQIAITEILKFNDIPAKVTINEAIDIAKKFSTAKSGRFVNGILDAIMANLQLDNKITKQGRGLIDIPAKRKRLTETTKKTSLSLPETAKKSTTPKKRIRRPRRSEP